MNNNSITLRQLIRNVIDKEKLSKTYLHIFSSKTESNIKTVTSQFSSVIKELLNKKKVKPYKYPILVKTTTDIDNKKTKFFDVCLLNPKYQKPPVGLKPWGGKAPQGYYNINLSKYNETYAFCYEPWSKIIDTSIINKTQLKNYELLGEILWVLTFYGRTEIQCKRNTKKLFKEFEKSIKEIKEKKCIKIPKGRTGNFDIVIPNSVIKKIKDNT